MKSTRLARPARTSASLVTSPVKAFQQALLKISKEPLPTFLLRRRKHPEQQYIQIDTTNILFICGGTFVGLEDIIARRLGKKVIGFGNNNNTQEEKAREEPVAGHCGRRHGIRLIPELIGRLPILGTLAPLNEEALVQVLTEPRNALTRQYKKLFEWKNASWTSLKELSEKSPDWLASAKPVLETPQYRGRSHVRPDVRTAGSRTRSEVRGDRRNVRGERTLLPKKNDSAAA